MTTHLPHEEIRDLLVVYALDAVDPDEAEVVEHHLRDCPRCRAEVVEFRETAAALASGHESAPPGIWDSIATSLEAAPAAEPPRLVLPFRSPSRWQRTAPAILASAAAVVVLVLGVRVYQQGDEIQRMRADLQEGTVLAAALAAEGDPAARHVELRSAEGVVLARAVLAPDGTGYLWSEGLPQAELDHTYQLWAIVGTERISAGLLGPAPSLTPFRVAGDVAGLALTDELAGGVVATQNQPVAAGLVLES